MRKPGTVAPLIYLRYPNGHLTLAPFSDCPTPDGSIREEADTLPAIDKVVDVLRRQEYEQLQKEKHYDMKLFQEHERRFLDKIHAQISSSATTPFIKDLLREYLKLRDTRKREKYHKIYEQADWYLYARENELGDRDASKEEVNLDKVNF
jgi:hypothetical protein